ncbi:MAG: hypothetical protein US83_C0009G0014 [Candidatus Falkowbacteria bacterium GW2011_GWC2_38_22]|uniref:Uncharacterized protein n=1 Tax=Candidatus Falkowbacteria bacterium GW2011_GWE1_38_31 TaxID=1618638 RepID=A0A0G0K398_9BACT|nr:MAG: hypothetical protein US73_C0012G0014 [Candidatus Falkowbacteria bacterium GW2011_GWF2_38_1205]KKQ61108.1 MAG: hypothetical protein US83_C0009G0014 [Candidatus Falkowbacteria bacterium GW2011_GWC2_38_22]KKQ63178.1 MAG: hypothetical protein US84_C0008G0071 [Candidatus Falkowbacteria bacterium GW2011_GWF1_38_22]KKQ65373.1 MAG: hypothetical protein US87_C0008G0069 [Candidatus Falkowbacteria bacterium GW2011_GWE2_38_254]KKQ69950.1 MAG: hypothetical protein US91_C0008G0070 [Candidatus Falkowb
MLKSTDKIKIKNKELQNKLNLFFHGYFGVIVMIGVFFLLYLGFVYIIKPKNERVTVNSQVMLVDKQSDKRMLAGALEKLIAYRLAYDSISQSEKEKISKILPGHEGKDNIFSNMEVFVLRQGLTLESIELNAKDVSMSNSRQRQSEAGDVAPASAGGIETIGLSLEISGVNSYERFKEFLITLEKNLRLIDVVDISYDQSAGILSLEAVAYYLNE